MWYSSSKTGISLRETGPLSFNENVSYNFFLCFDSPSNSNKVTDTLSLKVTEICPYYFDLEEKFLE